MSGFKKKNYYHNHNLEREREREREREGHVGKKRKKEEAMCPPIAQEIKKQKIKAMSRKEKKGGEGVKRQCAQHKK